MTRLVICALFVVLSTAFSFAETRVEQAIRLSQTTLSAFECAILASSGEESGRLNKAAISAGKQFLELAPKLDAEEQKSANPNIAILWRGVWGPSEDFILGQVSKEMERSTYDQLGNDTKLWESKKQTRYREKNCALIR
jgi:hypothetical protein